MDDGRPGQWRHDLEDPGWEEALAWLARQPGATPTGEEVLAGIEAVLSIGLPGTYREFLARTGGPAIRGTAFFSADGSGDRLSVTEATEEARRRGLFADAVVIAPNLLGGVDVLDLRSLDRGADPPVLTFDPYRYGLRGPDDLEDDEWESDGTDDQADSFTEYLRDAVAVAARLVAIEQGERDHLSGPDTAARPSPGRTGRGRDAGPAPWGGRA